MLREEVGRMDFHASNVDNAASSCAGAGPGWREAGHFVKPLKFMAEGGADRVSIRARRAATSEK